MNQELSIFAARLRGIISNVSRKGRGAGAVKQSPLQPSCCSREISEGKFSEFAVELFALQFQHNPAYRKICQARGATQETVEHWTQIPAVPTGAFKEWEFSCLAPGERTAVFHSSGTTRQKPSRHFHCRESLELYEDSMWSWFEPHVLGNSKAQISSLLCLAPPPEQAPHSSLAHMFETVRQKLGAPKSAFVGKMDANGAWILDYDAACVALAHATLKDRRSTVVLGTAFSFVHLLDFLAEKKLRFPLPADSRVMETGGYKNRSRSMPKAELHALITEWLGVPSPNIICEYGMSELSSQAYASADGKFQFPPWARTQIISPETRREAADGEIGLVRIFDLANVFSVAAIQTEDLALRRGDGFELVGRAEFAEPRGCSLMTA